MPVYKLTYFDLRGRAEIIRLIFAVSGVDYEDVRIQHQQWPSIKDSTPFHQLPMLEVDGLKLSQTHACARYLARKMNLAGKTEEEMAQADMLVDSFYDTIDPLFRYHFEKDETRKAEMKKKYIEEQFPSFMCLLEGLLKANHGGDKYFVGSELTWADMYFINLRAWYIMGGIADPYSKHPKLQALHDRVEKLPKIAEWIAKRPKSDM